MMVVGDSYVEANQVDAGKTAAELLHLKTTNEGRVYSIGLSGAPLSQYLVFAQYSMDVFQPGSIVFIIIANDFDQSLLKYYYRTRFHLFREDNNDLILQIGDYSISNTRKLLRRSAFIRYVMLNLEAKKSLDRLLRRGPVQKIEYIGNVPATVSNERISDSMRAVDAFFDQLPARSGFDAADILFVIDGLRPALYSAQSIENTKNSFAAEMMRYFEDQATILGYEVIDMQPVFIRKNRLDNSRFEFETDGHWNEMGHSLVANEIEKSSVFKATFASRAN